MTVSLIIKKPTGESLINEKIGISSGKRTFLNVEIETKTGKNVRFTLIFEVGLQGKSDPKGKIEIITENVYDGFTTEELRAPYEIDLDNEKIVVFDPSYVKLQLPDCNKELRNARRVKIEIYNLLYITEL